MSVDSDTLARYLELEKENADLNLSVESFTKEMLYWKGAFVNLYNQTHPNEIPLPYPKDAKGFLDATSSLRRCEARIEKALHRIDVHKSCQGGLSWQEQEIKENLEGKKEGKEAEK